MYSLSFHSFWHLSSKLCCIYPGVKPLWVRALNNLVSNIDTEDHYVLCSLVSLNSFFSGFLSLQDSDHNLHVLLESRVLVSLNVWLSLSVHFHLMLGSKSSSFSFSGSARFSWAVFAVVFWHSRLPIMACQIWAFLLTFCGHSFQIGHYCSTCPAESHILWTQAAHTGYN